MEFAPPIGPDAKPPAMVEPVKAEPGPIAPASVTRSNAEAAPPAPTEAVAPEPRRLAPVLPSHRGARSTLATAPVDSTADSDVAETQGQGSTPSQKAKASLRRSAEPVTPEPQIEASRLRPAVVDVAERVQVRADVIAPLEGGKTSRPDRPQPDPPLRLEPPPAPIPPQRVNAADAQRPAGVHIGTLEVRIVLPDAAKGSALRATAAATPKQQTPLPPAPPSSARLSRGFGAFGLAQG
jgi:hypothetical protein